MFRWYVGVLLPFKGVNKPYKERRKKRFDVCWTGCPQECVLWDARAPTFAIQLSKKYEQKNPKLIQFHPSYSYENFIEGLSVKSNGEFVPTPQILLKKCQEARENPDKNIFLIIDEINRGVLGKIFGELIIGLEYRESQKFELPYSGKTVSIPSNLVILGTMNTADRSIALVDYALRRRFFFIDMMPDEEILRGWLDKYSDGDSRARDGRFLTDYKIVIGVSALQLRVCISLWSF